MLYFIHSYRSAMSLGLQRGLLVTLVALLSVACSGAAEPNSVGSDSQSAVRDRAVQDSQETEVGAIADPDISNDNDSSVDSPEERNVRGEWIADKTDDGTPRSLSITIKGIESGSAYSSARTAFTNRGWIPNTHATTGPEYDWNNAAVAKMQSLGFPEFYDCAGDICNAQFVYQDRTLENGSILIVSADLSEDAEAPTIVDWAIEDTANTTYAQRNFNATLFNQIQSEQSFCVSVGQCGLDRYMLNDALLLSGTYGFGSTKISLIPTKPVSQATALTYAKALDTQRIISFESSRSDAERNAETYQEAGLPEQNVAATRGGLTQVTLFQTEDGKVSEVLFERIVL